MNYSTTAPGVLRRAAEIMDERGKQYDKPTGERSMGKCVIAFNTITGHKLTEAEGWLLLQLLKDVRQWQTPRYHQDSAEDCVAYAALKTEALANADQREAPEGRAETHSPRTGAGVNPKRKNTRLQGAHASRSAAS